MPKNNKEPIFIIDTLARLLEYLAANEDAELGNREILHRLISKEIQKQTESLLKA